MVELRKTRAKEPMKMLARLALVAALVASCGGDADPSDAGVVADASAADAAPPDAGACEGPASSGCEVVVGTPEQCPTLEEVCAGVCGVRLLLLRTTGLADDPSRLPAVYRRRRR